MKDILMIGKAIKNKYDFIAIFDVKNGNCHDGGAIRSDERSGHIMIERADIVRMTREYVGTVKGGCKGFEIYKEEIHRAEMEKVYRTMERRHGNYKTRQKTPLDRQLQKWLCRRFFDVRAFGTELTTGQNPGGNLAETVQFGRATRVEPVTSACLGEGGVGRDIKSRAPLALYKLEGSVTAILAGRTGFDDNDLELLWQALGSAFVSDGVGAVGITDTAKMRLAARRLIVFRHKSALGNAHSCDLYKTVRIVRKKIDATTGGYDDYDVIIERGGLPPTVEVFEKECGFFCPKA